LITKDGFLYTWGRNLDGQIGNGTRREVPIPTPLYYNPACIFSQIPPRHNDSKKMQELDNNIKSNDSSASNGNIPESNENVKNAGLNKKKINPIINAVGISCGYDYTIAIQPGYEQTKNTSLSISIFSLRDLIIIFQNIYEYLYCFYIS